MQVSGTPNLQDVYSAFSARNKNVLLFRARVQGRSDGLKKVQNSGELTVKTQLVYIFRRGKYSLRKSPEPKPLMQLANSQVLHVVGRLNNPIVLGSTRLSA